MKPRIEPTNTKTGSREDREVLSHRCTQMKHRFLSVFNLCSSVAK